MSRPAEAGGSWRDRVVRGVARVAAQAAAASVTTPDPATRTPPGTLAPVTARPTRRATERTSRSRRIRRRPGPISVILVLAGLLIAAVGLQDVTGVRILPSGFSSGSRPPPRKFPVLAASPPVGIAIRSLSLAAPVHPVGMAEDGTIDVPVSDRRDEAGWYDHSPTPGQYGPAIIVGHVDTRTGPAVFHELHQLRPGSKVEIAREDQSVAIFEVNSIQRFSKSELPVPRVYGDFSRPGLRLITCGGRWVGGRTGYEDNVIVFASLVSAKSPRK